MLITAGLRACKCIVPESRQDTLPDPLTAAEIRALEKPPERLTYTEIAAELYLSLHGEDEPAPLLIETRRHPSFLRRQARDRARHFVIKLPGRLPSAYSPGIG